MSDEIRKIAILPGDGIGPEVLEMAVLVLEKIAMLRSWRIALQEGLIGGSAIDHSGEPLPEITREICLNAHAVLLGSVGGPRWDGLPAVKRPEIGGLLALRRELALYVNLRPVHVLPALFPLSPLKAERLGALGIDLITVRELASDVYFGEPKGHDDTEGFDTMRYRREEVEKVAHLAFEIAEKRGAKVTSVDKANVLHASMLWRRVVTEVGREYSRVRLEHMYVDNAAMQLVLNPRQFDVILAGNMFGDILSDASAALSGSLGTLPSASLGDKGIHLYEPAGGSAPDIAGRGIANPVAAILSVALMAEYSFQDKPAADTISKAVRQTIEEGFLTADLSRLKKGVSTREMGREILARLSQM